MAVRLPNEVGTILPLNPVDGQVYVDYDSVEWRYDAETDLWYRFGVVESLPLASDQQAGLMSAAHKDLMDKIPGVPGGFGIITDRPLISPSNPDGVVSGDIELLSDSLDILCVGPDDQSIVGCPKSTALLCEGVDGPSAGLGFKLSESFLNTLLVNLPGPSGPDGDTGDRGLQGAPGYSQGPKGKKGPKGKSTDVKCKLSGYEYRDLPGLTDTAIVDLKVTSDCKLVYTKAPLSIPKGAAEKINATALSRSVTYDLAAAAASKSCAVCLSTSARVTTKFGSVNLTLSAPGSGVLKGCQMAQVTGVQTCTTGATQKQIDTPVRYTLKCGGTVSRPTLQLTIEYTACTVSIQQSGTPGSGAVTGAKTKELPLGQGSKGAFTCDYVADASSRIISSTFETPYTGCGDQHLFQLQMVDIFGVGATATVILDSGNSSQCDEGSRIPDWVLTQPPGDATPLDLNLVRLAKNKGNNTGDEVAFNTYPLSSFVADTAAHYQSALVDVDTRWRKQVKELILEADDKARTILSELANKLAECEFSAPAQVCVTTEACPIQPNVVSDGTSGSSGGGSNPTNNPTIVCCFVRGSEVSVPLGRVPIESIEPGHEVFGTTRLNRVMAIKRTVLGGRRLVGLNGSGGFFSEDHPFLSTAGWVCANPEMHARLYPGWADGPVGLLEAGTVLIVEGGTLPVESVDYFEAKSDTELYDLTLDGDHTYWVYGYAVHNCSPTRAAAMRAGFQDFSVGSSEVSQVSIGQRTWKVRT